MASDSCWLSCLSWTRERKSRESHRLDKCARGGIGMNPNQQGYYPDIYKLKMKIEEQSRKGVRPKPNQKFMENRGEMEMLSKLPSPYGYYMSCEWWQRGIQGTSSYSTSITVCIVKKMVHQSVTLT